MLGKSVAVLIGAFLAFPASAAVFKCVEDGTGKISFSDVPCHGKDSGEEIKVRPINQSDGSKYRQKADEDHERFVQIEGYRKAHSEGGQGGQQALQLPPQSVARNAKLIPGLGTTPVPGFPK